MLITDRCAVTFHYQLTNDAGELIDTSREGESLPYLHGANNIVPGLEQALVGKQAGDKLQVTVSPDMGYGEYNEAMVQQVPKAMFSGIDTLEIGMQFHAEGDSGEQHVVTVTGIEEDQVTVDGNHDLAGETLHFDVEVIAVREATEDEMSHGYVHNGHCGH